MHILLDIDGTVVDHRDRMYGLYEEFARAHYLLSLDRGTYFVRKQQGENERAIAAETFPAPTVDNYLTWKREHIESPAAIARDTLFPAVPQTLEALAAKHSLTALSARQSSDVLVRQLERLGIWRFFETSLAVTADRAGDAKTAAVARYVAETAAQPDEVVVVGDTEVEIAAAARNRVRCVSVEWGLRSRTFLLAHGSPKVVSTVEELRDVFGAS